MHAERLEREHPEVQAVQCSDDRSLLQRVGILSEFPALVAEFGVDPDDLAREGGCRIALRDPDAVIPFSRFAALFEEARSLTRCPHIGLLLGSRGSHRMLGLMGEYMANAPTMGVAMTDVVSHQHRYARGARPTSSPRAKMSSSAIASTRWAFLAIEQICDAAIAFAKAVIMELGGAKPIEVMFAHARPATCDPTSPFSRRRSGSMPSTTGSSIRPPS